MVYTCAPHQREKGENERRLSYINKHLLVFRTPISRYFATMVELLWLIARKNSWSSATARKLF